MGIIPTPTEYGDDCLTCWPADETPRLMKLFLSGISTGDQWTDALPPAPNGYHDIVQSVHVPCAWLESPGSHIEVGYFPDFPPGPQIALLITTPGAHHIFLAWQITQCATYFENTIVNPVGEFYYGGSAFITTPSLLQSMLELVTPITGPDPRMELYTMADGEVVVKFCSIQDATNIKIKIDTALL